MPFAFFSISTTCPASQQDALNRFIASHRVVRIDKSFHHHGHEAFWSFCVEWLPAESPAALSRPSQSVDYKATLTTQQFEVFSKLRVLRKQLGQKEGLPVYAIATNEQLAIMVREGTFSRTALLKIPGFGEAKANRFGTAFLEILNAHAVQLANNSAIAESLATNGVADATPIQD